MRREIMYQILDENDEMLEIVTLTDQDGEDEEFEVVGGFEYKGEEYIAMFPVEENDENEDELLVAIFKADYDDDEELTLTSIDDEALQEEVMEEFRKQFEELQESIDEDEEEDEDDDEDDDDDE